MLVLVLVSLTPHLPSGSLPPRSERGRQHETLEHQFVRAAEEGRVADMRRFIEQGVSARLATDGEGEFAIHLAASAGNIASLKYLIEELGEDVRYSLHAGRYRRFYRVRRGFRGADDPPPPPLLHSTQVDFTDDEGITPILAAAWHGHIVRVATTQRRAKHQACVLSAAGLPVSTCCTCQLTSVSHCHAQEAFDYLLERGANVDHHCRNGWGVVMGAVRWGELGALRPSLPSVLLSAVCPCRSVLI